ncbi:MAG: ABC transporter ATP-binding protein/permease [Bacteroidales bacterium]|jgi:ATP-binding cassette subfamily B protein|nr:ABC transporter ATP-binding protein/permease [Bacteroidales bacterium]
MKISTILNSATMGNPKRMYPMIWWTLLEYFFRGAPYGITLFVVWELFKPLQNPGTGLDISKIVIACISLAVSLLLLYLTSKKAYFKAYKTGYDICAEGRQKVAAHMKKLPMGFYNQRDPGDIGAYIVTDYANIEQMTTHIVPQFFGALIMPLILLIGLFFFEWKLALAATMVIPLAWPMLKLTNYIVKKLGVKHQKIKVNASSRMIEYIQGIRLIKAFNLGGTKFERLEKSFQNLKKASIKLEAAPGPTIIFASVLLNGGIVLIILLGFTYLLSAQVTLPVYILFLIMGVHIYQPLIHAMTFMAEMNYMKLGADRIDTLIKTPFLPEGSITEKQNIESIEFNNVHFSYNNIEVLKGLSLKIKVNTLTALVGPSGSGKTTLTRLIARFWDVNSGEILINGNNIKDYNSNNLMSMISIVFQDVYLFNDTIYNNIRVGREDATEAEIIEAAKLAQCHEFINSMPDKYQTMVGEGGSTLSGGEKQRISIARAILKDAPIILLDEATASLDPENELFIQKAINDLIRNKTVIIIAHRLNTIKNADNIVVINQGEITEQGRHHELMNNNSLYKNLWDEQQKIKGWKF